MEVSGYAIYGALLLCLCAVVIFSLLFLVLERKEASITIRSLFLSLLGLTIICASLIIVGFVNTNGGKAGIYCFTVLMCFLSAVLGPVIVNVGNELILKTLFKVMKKSDLDSFYKKRKQRVRIIKYVFIAVSASLFASAIAVSCLEYESIVIAWRVLTASLACGLIISIYFLQYIFAAFANEIEHITKQSGGSDQQTKEKMLRVAQQCRYGRFLVLLCSISPIINIFCSAILPMFWYIMLTQIVFILLGVMGMTVVFLPARVKEKLLICFHFENSSKISSSAENRVNKHLSSDGSSIKEKATVVTVVNTP